MDAREYENSTVVINFNGDCYLNGIKLPRSLGVGSCADLASDFDAWLGDWAGNLNLDALQGRDDVAEQLLLNYCEDTRHGISFPWDSPDTCGADLRRQLRTAVPLPVVLRFYESGVGSAFKPLAKLLGLVKRTPSVAQIARGTLARVGDFRSEAAAFVHYAKHAKGVILKNGKAYVKPGGADMPEFASYAEYRRAARGFMGGGKPSGAIEGIRKGGDLVRVDPATGYFGIRAPDGTIRTFFRPTDMSPMDYFRMVMTA